VATQTKKAKVYRGEHQLKILEPDRVDEFVLTWGNQVAKVHKSDGQIFRIDLAEKHQRSFASQTIYGQRAGDNSHCQHIGNRNLFR